MGLITDGLQIGRSALMAYQSALQVVGNNVSNAGTPGYVRQSPVLSPATGGSLPEGFISGGGVALSELRRNVDEALQGRIRVALGNQAGTQAEQQTIGRIESVLNELTDYDLSTLMQAFFNAFSELQNKPQDQTSRGLVLSSGERLAGEIQRQRQSMLDLRDELNIDLASGANRADRILRDVADLNVRITAIESSATGGANALRDQRDQLLSELGELVQIEVREQPDGGVNIYIGNEQVVQGGVTRGITTTLDVVNGQPKTIVRFADNNGQVILRGGRLAGLAAARDEHVLKHVESLNDLAAALVREVNQIHAQGQGLEAFTGVTGSYDVLDPAAALNSMAAGLASPPRNGSFLVKVTDRSAGTSLTTTITVDLDGVGTDDSLASLVTQLNSKVSNVTASVTADNRLQLTAAAGFEFTFSQDSSNVLAALGVNTFFTGSDAETLAVSSELLGNPSLLAAATQSAPGDGTNAGAIAGLAGAQLDSLNGRSLLEFYNGIVSQVAIKGAAAEASAQASEAISSSLISQRESVSGVNLDEETIALLKFQRSFQAAAQYTTIVDQLIEETLALVG